MDQKTLFVQRIREELGDEINPFYIEDLLKKDISELMQWMKNSLEDTHQTTLPETCYYAQQYTVSNSETMRDMLLFGTRILESRYKLFLFVLKEAKSRLEALQVS